LIHLRNYVVGDGEMAVKHLVFKLKGPRRGVVRSGGPLYGNRASRSDT